ncbi:sensor histidine kinase [Plebeiibacterium marinum]|uniref:histidine kinase n=1 Tax=Plebeiibacterium marinum TaxID=2992111 RepID=A0AAE3SJL3_9BACT|nr:sensor histidine kinase [Plebeiobacterium marinum]MCW3805599.1 ATP-binding protein [Plebeiobacterium marinum]
MGRSESGIRIIFTLLYVLLNSWCLTGQSDLGGFENYTRSEGLSHSTIQTVLQDSKGYIWVGSSDGLMRADGIYFDSFSKKNSYSSLLSDNTIKCIIEDENEYAFWIGTSVGGINRFDITRRDSVHFYIYPDADNPSSMVSINAIGQVSAHKFLVGTNTQGLYYFYPKTSRFEKIEEVFDTSIPFPTSIIRIEKSKNFIWVTSSNGLLQFSQKGEYITTYYFTGKSFTQDAKGNSLVVTSIKELDNDHIAFTSENALYVYNWQNNKLEKVYKAESKDVLFNCFTYDNKGGYWIGTEENGVFYYNESKKSVVNHTRNSNGNSIISNFVNDMVMCQDNSILWIATQNGLSKYDYYLSKFKQYDIENLTNNQVSSIFTLYKDSQSGYWVRGGRGTYYKANSDSLFKRAEWIQDRVVFQVKEDTESNLWFTSQKGVVVYSLKNKMSKVISFEHPDCDPSKLNFVTALDIDSDGILWLMSEAGIIRCNINTEQYKVFPLDKEESGFLHRFTDITISEKDGVLWISSRSGDLMYFNISSSVYGYVDVKKLLGVLNKPCIIMDLALEGDDKVWIATYGSGLLIYDKKSGSISTELSYGFMESYVYAIVDDGAGSFWLSTNQGICRVTLEDRSVKFYDQTDGTYCSEFNELAYCKASDGNILFGGINGFIEFNPEKIYKNQYQPAVFISSYVEDNLSALYAEELLDDVRYDTDSIITVKGDSEVKFYPSVLNYSTSFDNRIKWKLEGFDKDWKEGYAHESMTYNNLKKGTFTLKLKGTNNDGVECANVATLTIKVKAKFIDTTFFQILLVLVIVGAIVLLIRIRALWHKTQNSLLVAKVNEKTEALTNANVELEESKNKILNQKTELEIHRNYLEEIVDLRTADLEKAKVKAEESDQLKTSFLANLSHEIRTPMNAIIGFSNLLISDEFETSQQRHFLKLINQSSESLLALINDIIDISRIETGNIKLVKQKTNIPQLVKEIKEELIFEEKSKDVRFMQFYELNTGDMDFCTDRYRLKQIISNLLRNAFKYTSEGYVKLTVKSATVEGLKEIGFNLNGKKDTNFTPIVFIVEDTGIGIEEKDLKIIFEPFQKAQNIDKLYDGMGLGLSIVRNLVDLFGGEVLVESESQKGTKFYFFINKTLHSC